MPRSYRPHTSRRRLRLAALIPACLVLGCSNLPDSASYSGLPQRADSTTHHEIERDALSDPFPSAHDAGIGSVPPGQE